MRKEFYTREINRAVREISRMQCSTGKFDSGDARENARNQEAVLTLAWHLKNNEPKKNKNSSRLKQSKTIEMIEKGINYWCSLQKETGAFPERGSPSYAGTAFSSIAIAKTIELQDGKINRELKSRAEDCLMKAGQFLMDNENSSRANQEAAAAVALHELGKISGNHKKEFSKAFNKKIENVLACKTESGFFLEDEGIDLGYSSLTCELLASVGLEKECKDFVESLASLLFPDGTIAFRGTRTSGWIVLDALERLSKKYPLAGELAENHINAHITGLCNASHTGNKERLLMDAYRLCWAHDNCREKITSNKKSDNSTRKAYKPGNKPRVENNWSKEFPEGIISVRRKKYHAVFYLDKIFSQQFWTLNGTSVNLSENISGNTKIGCCGTVEEPASLNYKFDGRKLFVSGKCKNNYGMGLGEKILNKITSVVTSDSNQGFSKEFVFKDKEISVVVKGKKGVEQVPEIGKIKLEPGFEKTKGMKNKQSVFNDKKYWIRRRAFREKLKYLVKV